MNFSNLYNVHTSSKDILRTFLKCVYQKCLIHTFEWDKDHCAYFFILVIRPCRAQNTSTIFKRSLSLISMHPLQFRFLEKCGCWKNYEINIKSIYFKLFECNFNSSSLYWYFTYIWSEWCGFNVDYQRLIGKWTLISTNIFSFTQSSTLYTLHLKKTAPPSIENPWRCQFYVGKVFFSKNRLLHFL